MNMSQISARKAQLEERVTGPGYMATARDVAEAIELVNQYIDALEHLEMTVTPWAGANIDVVADQILKRWYP